METTAQAVNWLAIGAGTIVAFLFGWAVYSPMLFGKRTCNATS